MEQRRGEPHPRVLDEPDGFARESLTGEPGDAQNPHKLVTLAALAVLLVVTVVGTVTLVHRDLHLQSATTLQSHTSAGAGKAALTPVLPDPVSNGWSVPAAGAPFGDVIFSPSSPTRGYGCGLDDSPAGHFFAVTTDGGAHWQTSPVLVAFKYCSIQVSPTNPLDVVLTSNASTCGEGCLGFDAHYSTDGAQTWKTVPTPKNAQAASDALWAGQYLYLWSNATADNAQPGFFEVSANGGGFTSIDLSKAVANAPAIAIQNGVASGATLYLSVAYDGCGAAKGCTALVATGDGGKTWTQLSKTYTMQIVYAAGASLYAQITDPQPATIERSTDDGASWRPVTLPKLPGGETFDYQTPGAWLPAPDGTLFATGPQDDSTAYLHGSSWTVIPFSSQGGVDALVAVSVDPSGNLQRVWVLGSKGYDMPSIYWHAVP